MKNTIRASIAALALVFALPASADMARVVVVETDDAARYAAEIEIGKKILADAGVTSTIRVWRATAAGPNTGQIIVAIIYEDIDHFAKEAKMLADHDKFNAWLMSLDDIRTIVSDSLYQEM